MAPSGGLHMGVSASGAVLRCRARGRSATSHRSSCFYVPRFGIGAGGSNGGAAYFNNFRIPFGVGARNGLYTCARLSAFASHQLVLLRLLRFPHSVRTPQTSIRITVQHRTKDQGGFYMIVRGMLTEQVRAASAGTSLFFWYLCSCAALERYSHPKTHLNLKPCPAPAYHRRYHAATKCSSPPSSPGEAARAARAADGTVKKATVYLWS